MLKQHKRRVCRVLDAALGGWEVGVSEWVRECSEAGQDEETTSRDRETPTPVQNAKAQTAEAQTAAAQTAAAQTAAAQTANPYHAQATQ